MCEKEATGKNGKIDIIALAQKLLAKAKDMGVDLLLPVDHRCAPDFKDTTPHVTSDENIPADQV